MNSATAASDRINLDETNRKLTLVWPDGNSSSYHYVWLRHSGQCPHGMPNDTSNKIALLPDDPATLKILGWQIEGDFLSIHWSDNDIDTTHHIPTLKQSAYDTRARARRQSQPKLWNVNSTKDIPVFEFSSIFDTKSVLDIFLAVRDFGVARLTNVPTEPDTIATIADRFGPIQVNNYGRIFDVKTESNVTLGSNTGAYLGPHTDESYRHAPPGITFFHCLRAASDGNGESILVDGFHAAELLRQHHPACFDILSSVPVLFQRLALPEEDMRARGRIIVTDIDGNVEGIRFTDRTIPPQDLPEQYIEPVYQAIKAFWNIINTEGQAFTCLMQPGDLNIFDNQRILHGRTGFNPAAGQRHLQQCSVNRDEFHNTLRRLAAECNHDAWGLSMAGGALG